MRPTIRCSPLAAALIAVLAAGCAGDADFDAAARSNTTVGWEDYLRAHPDSAHARVARERLAALIEEREWQRARTADAVDAYERYLHGYPQGAHAHEALVAIANLNLAATPVGERPSASPPNSATGAIVRTPPAAVSAAPKSAPAPPRRVPAPAAPPRGGDSPGHDYRIQLGAFSAGSGAAERAWRALESRYATLRNRQPVYAAARAADGRAIYRLQVAGLDRSLAEALCTELGAQHDPCIVVPPAAAAHDARP